MIRTAVRLCSGSIRREGTDHLIITGERHLRKILQLYVDYYNTDRIHNSLCKDAPATRAAQCESGTVIALPRVGGLHQRYERRAA